MFSVIQKREIADAVQKILRATDHPELPKGEIKFRLQVSGAESWSWADIRNNGDVPEPDVNPHNEAQDQLKEINAIAREALSKTSPPVPTLHDMLLWVARAYSRRKSRESKESIPDSLRHTEPKGFFVSGNTFVIAQAMLESPYFKYDT